MIRGLSRRAFVRNLFALAASPAVVFKPQRARAQQPASPRRIGKRPGNTVLTRFFSADLSVATAG